MKYGPTENAGLNSETTATAPSLKRFYTDPLAWLDRGIKAIKGTTAALAGFAIWNSDALLDCLPQTGLPPEQDRLAKRLSLTALGALGTWSLASIGRVRNIQQSALIKGMAHLEARKLRQSEFPPTPESIEQSLKEFIYLAQLNLASDTLAKEAEKLVEGLSENDLDALKKMRLASKQRHLAKSRSKESQQKPLVFSQTPLAPAHQAYQLRSGSTAHPTRKRLNTPRLG